MIAFIHPFGFVEAGQKVIEGQLGINEIAAVFPFLNFSSTMYAVLFSGTNRAGVMIFLKRMSSGVTYRSLIVTMPWMLSISPLQIGYTEWGSRMIFSLMVSSFSLRSNQM